MEFHFLWRGLILGFSIAAPVGPISVLCIRYTLAQGWIGGLASGLGAATADAMYGAIAGFGLAFVTSFLTSQQVWLRLIGGAFLCYLGVKTFVSEPATPATPARGISLTSAYTSTFFLTLTNPITILSFTAAFAGLGLSSSDGNYFSAISLVAGVFAGSMLWWLVLSSGVGLARMQLTPMRLTWLNRISGAIVTAFGLLVLLNLKED